MKTLTAILAGHILERITEREPVPTLRDLQTLAEEIESYLPRVSALLLKPAVSSMNEIISTGGGFESCEPWAGKPAAVKLDFQAWCRDAEETLEGLVFRKVPQRRASSDNATLKALQRLPMLTMTAAGTTTTNPRRQKRLKDESARVEAGLRRWAKRMRHLLDEARADEQIWINAPIGVVCPLCAQRMLLPPDFMRDWRLAVATCRDCIDDEGTRVTIGVLDWVEMVTEKETTA